MSRHTYSRILELGQANKLEELQDYVKTLNEEDVKKLVETKILEQELPRVLGFLFDSLDAYGPSREKRLLLIETLLKEIEKQSCMPVLRKNEVIVRVVLELDKLQSDHLVKLTEVCITQLQKDSPDKVSWKDLLPKLMYMVNSQSLVHHCGSDMTGAEYRSQVVHTLCMVEWKGDTIIKMADMFTEVSLSEDEMQQVMGKLLECLPHLEPSEVPPLVHHLLKLCGNSCCLLLLLHVQEYFTTKAKNCSSNSDDQEINSADSVSHASDIEVKQSKDTVMFHIHRAAGLGRQSICKMLKTLQHLSQAPELIFRGSHFLPSTLFLIASVCTMKKQVMVILRTTVNQAILDEDLRTQSALVRELLPSQADTQAALESLIKETPLERSLVLNSLIELCMELLLSYRKSRSDKTTQQLWAVGSALLLAITTKNNDAIFPVTELLFSSIMSERNVQQFLDCFHQLVAIQPRSFMQNQIQMYLKVHAIEQLDSMLTKDVAEQLVLALLPLLHLSESLCNNLVIALRKCLTGRQVEGQRLGVSGFLLMLQHLKVKRFSVGLSQQTSASSTWSQTSEITVHSSTSSTLSTKNCTALCLELLDILKQAFRLQAEVKLCLYQGLHEVLCNNPEMGLPALEMLINHLNTFETLPTEKCPLHFEHTVKLSTYDDEELVLQEPLGHLIVATAEVFFKIRDTASEEHSPWMDGVNKTLSSISERMIQCSLSDFGFDEGDLAIEDGLKGSKKILVLGQILSVYEGLMCFHLLAWKKAGLEQSKKIMAIFKAYSVISAYLGSCRKPSKKKATEDTQATADTVVGVKRKRQATGKPSSSGNSDANHTKIIPVVNFNVMQILLDLLYNEEVGWTDNVSAGHLRCRQEFHKFSLTTLLQMIQYSRMQRLSAAMDKQSYLFQQYCNLGWVVYQNCVKNLAEMSEEKPSSAALAMEAFCELLSIFSEQHSTLFPHFLHSAFAIIPGENQGETSAVVGEMCNNLQKLLVVLLRRPSADGNEEDEDPAVKKLPKLVLLALKQLYAMLESTQPELEKALQWVRGVVLKQEAHDEGVVRALLALLLDLDTRKGGSYQSFCNLARHILELCKTIDDEELPEVQTVYKKLAMVDEDNISAALQVLCTKMKESLDHVTWIIKRFRLERKKLMYLLIQDKHDAEMEIKANERRLCGHLDNIIEVAMLLTSSALPPEQGETTLKMIRALYSTLSNLVKHFLAFSSRTHAAFRGTNFEKVVRVAGKQLSINVNSFISYLEEKQQELRENNGKKLSGKYLQRKVLRESDCMAQTVYEMDCFSRSVIKLSVKTKTNLKDHIHLGVSHDFRINSDVLMKALDENNVGANSNSSEESSNENERSVSANNSSRLNASRRDKADEMEVESEEEEEEKENQDAVSDEDDN